jgi:trimethylamine:corrinoid methyltransferase-like protein
MSDATLMTPQRERGGQYERPRLDPAVDEELNAFLSRRIAERPDQWR